MLERRFGWIGRAILEAMGMGKHGKRKEGGDTLEEVRAISQEYESSSSSSSSSE